jgi:hypothetical protein
MVSPGVPTDAWSLAEALASVDGDVHCEAVLFDGLRRFFGATHAARVWADAVWILSAHPRGTALPRGTS